MYKSKIHNEIWPLMAGPSRRGYGNDRNSSQTGGCGDKGEAEIVYSKTLVPRLRGASMPSQIGRAVAVAAVIGLIVAFPTSVLAYVEAPITLGDMVKQSTNIVQMQVVKVDREKNLIIYQKLQDIKGKHPQEQIKHNIGRGGLRPG